MKLLDSYLVKEIIYPFIFGIAAFTSIIAGSTLIFQLISKAMKYGFGIGSTIQLFVYKLPAVISLTLPMALLLATILVIGRLSSDLEILALRSAGLVYFGYLFQFYPWDWQLALPILCLMNPWFLVQITMRRSY